MGIGFPEILVITTIFLLPAVVVVWVVLTVREVRQSQRAIDSRLEAIERRLREQ